MAIINITKIQLTYEVGDVLCVDSNENIKILKSATVLADGFTLPDGYTPIAICVIPQSHDVYGNGKAGWMSLKSMSCSTPLVGSTSETGIYWGQYRTDVSTLTNYNQVITTSSSSTSWGYLPLNGTYNTNATDSNKIPSPYSLDGGRNPLYYDTTITSVNALSDFNGYDNTQKLIKLHTANDLSTATTISNQTGSTYAPAAACCYKFSPSDNENLKGGNWYLPAEGELGYIVPKMLDINSIINSIGNTYAVSLSSSSYWSSSEYSNSLAWRVGPGSGYVNGRDKGDNSYMVRAFLQY